jgi:hypothetical protein
LRMTSQLPSAVRNPHFLTAAHSEEVSLDGRTPDTPC